VVSDLRGSAKPGGRALIVRDRTTWQAACGAAMPMTLGQRFEKAPAELEIIRVA
jgi:hypothetical protein